MFSAFAVPKDEDEDRVITDPAVNQLLDPDKLPRPRFAYIPKLRATRSYKPGVLVVSKRDARHYFHSLRIGRKWHKWLCGPPIVTLSGHVRHPACRSAPMGFGPSAGWAQALTDVTTTAAGLDLECRLHPDELAPRDFPIWGGPFVMTFGPLTMPRPMTKRLQWDLYGSLVPRRRGKREELIPMSRRP